MDDFKKALSQANNEYQMRYKHGKVWTYMQGCRCGPCRAAKSKANREYQDRIALRTGRARARRIVRESRRQAAPKRLRENRLPVPKDRKRPLPADQARQAGRRATIFSVIL